MIKLENYKIIKKIASGGMGDVYLAEHTVLETKVAIKSLHPNLVNDEDFRKRFRTEAKTQWKLSHPNIVKLTDFQERKDGLFLIMEYVEGKQLNDYISDVTGPMPDEKLFPLFKEILSAINFAHSKGLIHRDIKPSNILITAEGNAKVIDFGIAKSSDEDKGLTKTGVQVGTVSYMSPEQVNAEKLDKLTDIYSLGVILFQMAVGKAPYSAQTNTFKIQLSIVSDPLPNPKEIYPSVSDKLVSIIEKATQKNKRDRFKSCDEFIKSFDNEVVAEKTKSNPEKTINKPLKDSKNTVSKKKRKVPLFIYIVVGLISVLSIYYFVEENRINNIKIERLAKLEKDRLAKLEKDRLAKLEKDRLAKLEKDRLAKLEKDRLAKLINNRTNNSNNNLSFIKTESDYNGTYTGTFKNGLKHGKGKYTWKNGGVYEGDWINGEKTGKGKRTWKESGNVYEGDFLNGEKTGKGKYTYKNGDVYEGDFVNLSYTGKGKYTFKNGDVYEGDWINDLRTGKGKFTWRNGDVFVGDFNKDIKGEGRMYFKSSGKIEFGEYNKRGEWIKK